MDRHKSRNSRLTSSALVKCLAATTRRISSHPLLAVLTILVVFGVAMSKQLVCATSPHRAQQPHEEELIRNPLILDPSTLYDNTRLAASGDLSSAVALNRRSKRSTAASKAAPSVNQNDNQQQVFDACQSKVELLTPYYASNSKGKLRTVVNSALMQQAIQVETCVRSPSADRAKCNAQPDCGCEQKYKWHRLLVLDPSESGASRGLFMDWFLYPSACVCRCRSPGSKQFLRSIKAS